jgi:hypothetical protein
MFSEDWWASDAALGTTRCRATARQGGGRCRKAVGAGGLVCRIHGGAAPQTQRKARERVLLAADDAISQIIRLMEDQSVPPQIRLAAARDLADRADLGGASKVELELKPWQSIIPDILVDLPELGDDPTGVAVTR